MSPRPAGWELVDLGPAPTAALLEPFPASDGPDGPGRLVRVCRPSDAAVVLGSTQPSSMVDAAAAGRHGLVVLRRRSGGGAVTVASGAQLWVDVWLPRADRLWDDDVVRSSWWLGEVWAAALAMVGVAGADVHKGRATVDELSQLACFAGRGPGEAFVSGRKVVGLAQRRQRSGALLSCMAPQLWDPAPLAAVLRGEAVAALSSAVPVAAGFEELSPGTTADDVLDAFLVALAERE